MNDICYACVLPIAQCGPLTEFDFHEASKKNQLYCSKCIEHQTKKQKANIDRRLCNGEKAINFIKPQYIHLYNINNNYITNHIDNSNVTNNDITNNNINNYYVQQKPEEKSSDKTDDLQLLNNKIDKLIEKINQKYADDYRDDIKIKQFEEQMEKEKTQPSKLLQKDLEKREFVKAENAKLKARLDERYNSLYKDKKIPEILKLEKPIYKKCSYCKDDKIFPFEFMDSNDEIRSCHKCFECCENCKISSKLAKMRKMEICECGAKYYCKDDNSMIDHYDSALHKKNMASIGKLSDIKYLTSSKLFEIVRANLNDNGTLKISNYKKLTKNQLIEKLKEIDHLIIPDTVQIKE